MVKGIDRADPINTQSELDWLSCLASTQGVQFVGRYYKPTNLPNYQLTLTEAQNISNLGLNLVVVFQANGRTASDFDYNIGRSHCSRAIECAEIIGQPTSSGIYFAVDFDAFNTPGAMTNVEEYFRGVKDLMADYYKSDSKKWKIGIYAGRQVCESIKSMGLAELIWQAAAWRYGQDAAYNIKQTQIDVEVTCGVNKYLLDWDDAPGSYGGFSI